MRQCTNVGKRFAIAWVAPTALLIALSACNVRLGRRLDNLGSGTPPPPPASIVPIQLSFAGDIRPIMQANCVACHSASLKSGGIALDTYTQSDYVGTNAARWSRVLARVTDNSMPPTNPKLTASQKSMINTWINQGLLENPQLASTPVPPPAPTPPVVIVPPSTPVPPPAPPATSRTYIADIQPMMQSSCVGCHNAGLKSAGLALDVYNQTDYPGGALAARWGKVLIRIAAGTMPPNPPLLAASQIQIVQDWINQGMPQGVTAPPPGTPPPPPVVEPPIESTIAPSTVFTLNNNSPKPRVRRLTQYEYGKAVAGLTGITPDLSLLGAERLYFNLPTEASTNLVRGVDEVNSLLNIATTVAETANITSVITCGTTSCSNAQITAFLQRAWHRAPVAKDTTDFAAIYAEAKSEKDHAFGMRAVLQAALMSPYFLYRTEIGSGTQLTSKELAAKLSFFLWGEAPDATLRSLADNDTLSTGTNYTTQVDRLLNDPRTGDQIARFVVYYLGLSKFSLSEKVGSSTLGTGTQDAMFTEVKTLAKDVLFTQRKPMRDLFLANYTFMNNRIATLYGVSGITSSDFQKVNLNTADRMGVLSTPLVLAAHAKESGRSPVQRGLFMVTDLMCLKFPEEAGVPVMSLPNIEGLNYREKFAVLENQTPCLYCHRSLNAGFAFDQFDVIGRKTTSVPYNEAIGILKLPGDPSMTFQGPVETAQQFASHREVNRCVSAQLYRFAQGRHPGVNDMGAVTDTITAVQTSFLSMMRSIALSTQFRAN